MLGSFSIFSIKEQDQTIKTSLGTIMDGVCRALKIRIEQVLVSHHDTILYKISNLIKFYDHTIRFEY